MENLKCPNCGCALGNGVTVCGECGKECSDGEQSPVQEEKRGNNKIYGILAILLAVVAGAALLVFTGLVPNPFRNGSAAAIVNGEKISSQDVDQKLELYKKVYGQGGHTDFSSPEGKAALADMKRQILHTMIQEKVLLTEAAKEKISVSKEEIAEKIASIKKDMNLSESDFEGFLKNHAINLTNFEKRIEKEALIAKLIAKGTQERGQTMEAWLKELNSRARIEVFAK